MNLKSAKGIWDYLKKEYQRNERTKNMQVLNLMREFEMQKIKETKNMKDYIDKLPSIINNGDC
jgi:ferritin